jgi:hypothetical protein
LIEVNRIERQAKDAPDISGKIFIDVHANR